MDKIDSFYRGKLLTLNAHSSNEHVKRIYDDVAEKYDKVCLYRRNSGLFPFSLFAPQC